MSGVPRRRRRFATRAGSVGALALVVGCASASTQQKPDESSTAQTAAGESDNARVFESTKYGFRWRIPTDWEFVEAEEMGVLDAHPGIEMVAARKLPDGELALLLMVNDVMSIVPGDERFASEERLAELEADTVEWMQAVGLEKTGSGRLRIFGADAIRVDGQIDDGEGGTTYASVLVFHRNRRRFKLRCFSVRRESGTPCESALQEFVIHETPDSPQPGDVPRVLHLREEKFELAFDAPDDGWLAVGPRTAFNGAQLVWIWTKDGRQIDVQVLDHAGLAERIDEAKYAALMADLHRKKPGTAVTVKTSELSGLPCTHIEVNPKQGHEQDLFLQKRGAVLYGLLVTAPKRDQALIKRARAGLRIGK